MTEQKTGGVEKSVLGLNVLVLPDKDTSCKAVNLSSSIAENIETRFVLDGVELLPHLTLYLTEYPSLVVPEIENVLADLSKENRPISINMKGFSEVSGFIFWDAQMNDELYKIHELTLNALSSFREVKDSYIELPGLSVGQRAGLDRYGYALALSEYKPHITLTRLENQEEVEKVLKTLPDVEGEFTVSSLVLAKAGAEGTCPGSGIIRRFELGKNN